MIKKSRIVRIPEDVFFEIENIRKEDRIHSFSEATRRMADNSKIARYANKKNMFNMDEVFDAVVDPFNLFKKKKR